MENKQGWRALPRGFSDANTRTILLEAFARRKLVERALSYGFELIKTPCVGFESTFIEGGINTTADKIYSFTDKKHRSLVLSPDSTPQLIRWYLSTYSCRRPASVCFQSRVTRYRGNKDRSWTQYGIALVNEKIYENSPHPFSHLAKLYIEYLTFDLQVEVIPKFGDHSILRDILSDNGLDGLQIDIMFDSLRKSPIRNWIEIIEKYHLSTSCINEVSALLSLKIESVDSFSYEGLSMRTIEKIHQIVEIAQFCTSDFNVKFIIEFNDFHASELQDNIVLRLMHPTMEGHYVDGGCYRYYLDKIGVQPCVFSFYSIAGGLKNWITFSKLNESKIMFKLGILVTSNKYSETAITISDIFRKNGFASRNDYSTKPLRTLFSNNIWVTWILLVKDEQVNLYERDKLEFISISKQNAEDIATQACLHMSE